MSTSPRFKHLSFALLALLARAAAAQTPLVASGEVWRYHDQGGLGASSGWTSPDFDDSSWSSGPSQLGYGDGDEATLLDPEGDPANRPITTYFRKSFSVASRPSHLTLTYVRDASIVVYVNGAEVARDNLPEGLVEADTRAFYWVSSSLESRLNRRALDPALLVPGSNVVVAEVHKYRPDGPDLSFDLELIASDAQLPPALTRGPYLQISTPDGVHMRWRTDLPSESVVRFGSDPASLDQQVESSGPVTEHDLALTGLTPDTRYYYSVGTASQVLAGGDPEHFFWTAPAPGVRRPIRIWVIGDSGSANAIAGSVRGAYLADTGARRTDAWLTLGDNAYPSGTDLQHQLAFFETYPGLLRRGVVWPSLGNHDILTADALTQTGPYFEAFRLPTQGEAGGVASGTEAHYSFDYGNVHFIALDSNDGGNPTMLTWLATDLAANQQDWTVAYFHHAPYSRGTHDSDLEVRPTRIRENVLPMLEAAGVDVVLAGHSHNYERSFLIDGHYGYSDTLEASMILDAGNGRRGGSGAYTKATLGPGPHEGTVYMVAGSASAPGQSGSLDHPVMIQAASVPASVVLSVDRNRLDAHVLTDTGAVLDRFAIDKPPPPAECADGIDNDADGLVDHPEDPGCPTAAASRENPACDDGIDNDGDGWRDQTDPGCRGAASRTTEQPRSCGLGFEWAPLMVPLMALRRLRARCR